MVPLWVISLITQPFGSQLPKHPKKWVPSFSQYGQYEKRYETNSGAIVVLPGSLIKSGIPKGNLENQEYEFWIGSVAEQSKMATCRVCRYMALGKDDQIRHFAAGDCGTRLKGIATLLWMDKKCVICDSKTNKKIWGFPLCGKECIHEWKFGHVQAQGFLEARAMQMMTGNHSL